MAGRGDSVVDYVIDCASSWFPVRTLLYHSKIGCALVVRPGETQTAMVYKAVEHNCLCVLLSFNSCAVSYMNSLSDTRKVIPLSISTESLTPRCSQALHLVVFFLLDKGLHQHALPSAALAAHL